MCTLSWFADGNGYHVFFNRDEQKTRAVARPPSVFTENSVRFIMPIDPVGGGSWISTNEYGVTVALLNFYQGSIPEGVLVSRGNIVKRLAIIKSLEEAERLVNQMPLKHYAPFSLVLLSTAQLSQHQRIRVLRWDGHSLQDYACASPLISSAVQFENVTKNRLKLYREMLSNKHGRQNTVQDFYDYHSSHWPNPSAVSVCMHRSDAHTVSFSHVAVSEQETSFHYLDGAPCEADSQTTVKIMRGKENSTAKSQSF